MKNKIIIILLIIVIILEILRLLDFLHLSNPLMMISTLCIIIGCLLSIFLLKKEK